MNDQALAAESVTRMDRDQRARTRNLLDPDEMVAVDAENTAWLAAVLDSEGWSGRRAGPFGPRARATTAARWTRIFPRF